MKRNQVAVMVVLAAVLAAPCATAGVRLPHIFGDRMVLQREKPVRVWGWADKGEKVTVSFAGQTRTATADKSGKWMVKLDPMKANATGRTLLVKSSIDNRQSKIADVVVGEVWVCGGQSNMEASLCHVKDAGLELVAARLPDLRVMTVPLRAAPAPLDDFPRVDEYNSWTKVTERKGDWLKCTADRAKYFPAVGYFFAKRLHASLDVPVGLIDTSWGGTTVEAWISRATLKKIPEAAGLLEMWDKRVAAWSPEKSLAERIRRWEGRVKKLKAEGKTPPPKPTEPLPSPAINRNNPGASYNAIVAPIAGYTVRGALFYQGINNCVGSPRPGLYRKTFGALIGEWRRVFGDKEMPFGICQTISWGFPADGRNLERDALAAAPYIREAQLKAHLGSENTGLIVTFDLGHIQMHAPYKKPIGERAARWALAKVYEKQVTCSTPVCNSVRKDGNRMVLTFSDYVSSRYGGRAHPKGFIIAGADERFYHADAVVSGKEVRVSSPFVSEPAAVRYAWATFPAGDLLGRDRTPVSPFRTDDRPGREDTPFAERNTPEYAAYRGRFRKLWEQADRHAAERRAKEARHLLEQEK